MPTESEFEARRAKWNQIRGARVGDWYEMKGGRRHRFGKDLGEGLKLAAETLGDLFSLNDDGVAYLRGSSADSSCHSKIVASRTGTVKKRGRLVWRASHRLPRFQRKRHGPFSLGYPKALLTSSKNPQRSFVAAAR